jgi:hypothetical protein
MERKGLESGKNRERILGARGINPRGVGVEGCTLRGKKSKPLPEGF